MGIALADDFAVGFVTTNIIGAATAIGDTDEANALDIKQGGFGYLSEK